MFWQYLIWIPTQLIIYIIYTQCLNILNDCWSGYPYDSRWIKLHLHFYNQLVDAKNYTLQILHLTLWQYLHDSKLFLIFVKVFSKPLMFNLGVWKSFSKTLLHFFEVFELTSQKSFCVKNSVVIWSKVFVSFFQTFWSNFWNFYKTKTFFKKISKQLFGIKDI